MRLTQVIIIFLIGVFLAQSVFYYPSLPETMATHFDGAGNPDRWMTKPFFFIFEGVLLFLMIGIFSLIPSLTNRIPTKWINLPNKDYWFADERKEETIIKLKNYNDLISIAILILFIVVNHFVFEANINKQPLPTTTMWIILLSTFGFVTVWLILFLLQFRRPK